MTFGTDEAIQMINNRLDALESNQQKASEDAQKQAETIAALAQTLAKLDGTIASLQSFLETWKALQGAQKTVTAIGGAAMWITKAFVAVALCWGAFKVAVMK